MKTEGKKEEMPAAHNQPFSLTKATVAKRDIRDYFVKSHPKCF